MTWWAISGMAVITFLNRYAFLTQVIRYKPGEKVRRFLSYSSYAVLTAIWAPIVFEYEPNAGLGFTGIDYLAAASTAAIMTALRTPSIVTVIVSTTLFFMIRFL